MPDVEQLFHDYVAEHRSGGDADPRSYLSQVEGLDRSELAALIDTYLARSPGKTWDAKQFADSDAERVSHQIATGWDLEGEGETAAQGWRELLPALRNRAQVMRRELVERLAQGIGHPEDSKQVAAYYHQMELGQLPAEGVSNRVLGVLAEILGESAEKLRAAGSVVSGETTQTDAMTQIAYARTAVQDSRYSAAPPPASLANVDASVQGAVQTPDSSEVDRLFTGGPEAG